MSPNALMIVTGIVLFAVLIVWANNFDQLSRPTNRQAPFTTPIPGHPK